MLKWYIKYLLSTLLGIFPFKYKLHSKIQNVLGNDGLDEEEMVSRVTELFSLTLKYKNSLEGINVLEIGTGWFPYVPIFAYLYGAKNIVTVDLNPWLTVKTFRETINSVVKNKDVIVSKLDYWGQKGELRFDKLQEITNENVGLEECLQRLNIKYLPEFDVCDLNLGEKKKCNLILSSNVLEHIPARKLQEIHLHLSKISTNDALAVHRFNPADHFANLSGSTISFLSVPDYLWKILGGNGVSFHNRLRSREHAEIVVNSSWEVEFWADAIDQKAIKQIHSKKINLLERYREMDLETLCAFYSWFVLKQGNQESLPKPVIVKWVTDAI